jgi:oligopeptidase A
MTTPSFIHFENFDPTYYKIKVQEIISENNQTIEALTKAGNYTYKGYIKPIDSLNEKLLNYFTPLSHLNSVANTALTESIHNQCDLLVTDYFTSLSMNANIYSAYKEIYEKEENTLTTEQKKVVENGLRDFELGGVSLPPEKKEAFKKITMQLSELANTFSQNVLKATNNFSLIVRDDAELSELPESDKKIAETEAHGNKVWKFTLQMPSYLAYMTYSSNRKNRKKLERAYITRAPQNGKIIQQILELRHAKARLLGFKNYAEFSLATKIASSPGEVLKFLEQLAVAGRPFAKKEAEELKSFANANGLDTSFRSFDRLYYSEKLKKQNYDLDESKYLPYLEKSNVVNGLLTFVNRIFGIEFIQIETNVWDKTVSVFDLKKKGSIFARLYFDLESRSNKKGGAWLHNWQTHHIDANGNEHPASAFIVANFPPSTPDQPSCLKPSDVVTLFHEMGHALQHLCSTVKEIPVSGISGVEWDAVEFPSQFLENFAYSKEVLSLFAKHYKTGEVLPDDMIQKLVDSKNYHAGLLLIRQLEFGVIDMKIHVKSHDSGGVQKTIDSVRKKISVLHTPSYNKFQNSFSHIFAGGYAAGYYSYKWAELLSADAFLEFQKKQIFNAELAESYYKNILEKGGSENAMILFQKFLGRYPDILSLLRLYGMEPESLEE